MPNKSIVKSIYTDYKNILVGIIILFYISGYLRQRYFTLIPTIPIYPDNNIEVLEVKRLTHERNRYYLDLFKKTDRSVTDAFIELVDRDITIADLDNIALSPHLISITLVLKTIFNRARPLQIDNGLNVQYSISANTPAFPSGHCIQAYYLAKYLSKIYPERTQKLYRLAEDCALARVYAGLHYPSDNQFGKYIGLHII